MFWDSSFGVSAGSGAQRTEGFYTILGKRLLDLSIGLMLLPLAMLLILLICATTAFFGPTGLYAHTRVGRHGCLFKCWKIKTMIPDADKALRLLCKSDHVRHTEWQRFRKLSDDPRILPLGRFLRLTSLDELPQIWNVVRGEMSLVGPRPVTPEELPLYGDILPDYLRQRPGMTGLWQVTARRTGCFEQRVALDQQYANGISLRQDLWILARTLPVLLQPSGR